MNRKLIAFALTFASASALLMTASQPFQECTPATAVAHRGLPGVAPENTLPAIYSAARTGAEVIEIDIQFTRTDVPMLMHDSTVDRTTDGTGSIPDMYVFEVRQLDAGSWFGAPFAGEQVPTFYEALAVVEPFSETMVIADLKGNITKNQAAVFLNRIEILGMQDRVVLSSHRPTQIAKVQQQASWLLTARMRGSVHHDTDDPVAISAETGSEYYMPEAADFTADHVAALHDAGIEVITYTTNDPAGWQQQADIGIDWLVTDRPLIYEGWAGATC